MKVVLFCGGLGTRLQEYSESAPKPLVNVGSRPILWHVMRYYAHFGHKDFILCLGYKADSIKQYFVQDHEARSSTAVAGANGQLVDRLLCHDEGWNITFVDTGLHANVGMRLKAVQPLLEGEEMFLANYSDGLSDVPLPAMVEALSGDEAVAIFAGVAPTQTFHVASVGAGGRVSSIQHVKNVGMRMNGGFFVFRRQIFDWIQPGEDLVEEPFRRLAAAGKLLAYPHDGFWACMDTFKDKQLLEDLYAGGHVPWAVWKSHTEPGLAEAL